MLPKTAAGQAQLEGLVGGMPESGGSYFIGMTRVDGHWLWDDGSPVFVTSENFFNFFTSYLAQAFAADCICGIPLHEHYMGSNSTVH